MKEFKEKPKLGKAKEKPKSALLPRQAVHMMKEKYIKEMDQRPKGAEDSTQQAPDQVEHAGRWAADELTGRAVEQGREYAKKKFAAARGEAQAGPEVVPHGNDGPPVEDTPWGQSAPEYPAAAPVEYQEMERSPTAPKERPQVGRTATPIKDRQTVVRRAAVQERPQPYRTTQTALSGQTRAHEGTYPLKERPTAQAVKALPAVDMPRTAVRDTMPRTATRQPTAGPARRSEAVPSKFRPQQALKERNRVDVPRTADRAAIHRTTTPRTAAGQVPAAHGGRSEAVPLKVRQQKALKERPQLSLRRRGVSVPPAVSAPGPGPDPGVKAPRSTKAALPPKLRRGAVKAPTRPAARSAAPVARAAKAAHRQMQRRIFTQAAKPVKSIGAVFRRAVQAVAKAAAAVTGAASAIVGGCVLLVALIIVIVIAAVANSPFGLFFAQEPNAPGAVSVSQAVGSVNMAYNGKLELLQAGDYDSIDIQGAAPDWPDVLAVFAVKVAGADVGGMDVATLDPDRVDKLTAVFWDMTDIATRVEIIDHPATDSTEAWTEKILHITITPKTADDMRTTYAFTRYQNTALDELLADRAALSSLAGSLSITSADVLAVLQALPDDLSPERRAVVEKVLSLVGKVNYFWGGKSYVIGWDSRWGTLQKVTSPGSSTSGTYRPYGLDCSGFLDWALRNAGLHSDGHWYIGRNLTAVSQADAIPGDFALYPDASHVGMIVGRNAAGKLLVCHCSYGMNNVVVPSGVSAGGASRVGGRGGIVGDNAPLAVRAFRAGPLHIGQLQGLAIVRDGFGHQGDVGVGQVRITALIRFGGLGGKCGERPGCDKGQGADRSENAFHVDFLHYRIDFSWN